MKAVAVFPRERSVRIIDCLEPELMMPDQVKLRILEVGVCGTDRELCHFEYGTPPEGQDYFILGHEMLAEVLRCGDAVKDLVPGDLVVSAVRLPCDDANCFPCHEHHQDYCVSGRHREHGIKELDGFMAEYVVERRKYLYKVPSELRSVGVLVEPLTIAEKAFATLNASQSRFLWRNEKSRSAVVLGAGPVGILGAMKFLREGYRTYVYSLEDRESAAAQLIESIGASYICSREASVDELKDCVGRIDVVYEALGAAQVSIDVLQCLGPNGTYLFTGAPPLHTLDAFRPESLITRMVRENQAVIGIVNAGADQFRCAISDLQLFKNSWPEALLKLITKRVGIEDFAQAVDVQAGGMKRVVAIVQGH